MRIILRDYFLFNRVRILRDAVYGYLAVMLALGGVVLGAIAHDAMQQTTPSLTTILLVGLAPGLLIVVTHSIAACIVGIRLAHTAGLPLAIYTKSDLYEEHGRAVLRLL